MLFVCYDIYKYSNLTPECNVVKMTILIPLMFHHYIFHCERAVDL